MNRPANSLVELEGIALQVVSALSDLALEHYDRGVKREQKPDRTWVSQADREVEQLARRLLEEKTPGVPVYGEEFGIPGGDFDADEDGHWVVDPIDGTVNFLSRVPTWSVLLAYVEKGVPKVGVVALPALGEVFSACVETPATHGRLDETPRVGVKPPRQCQPSSTSRLEEAHVGYSSPTQFRFRGLQPQFLQTAFRCHEFRTQADAFGHTRVLCGGTDAMLDVIAAPYDLAAIQVLARQTPGVFFSTLFFEERLKSFSRGGALLFATAELGRELLRLWTEETSLASGHAPSELLLEPHVKDWAAVFHRLCCGALWRRLQEGWEGSGPDCLEAQSVESVGFHWELGSGSERSRTHTHGTQSFVAHFGVVVEGVRHLFSKRGPVSLPEWEAFIVESLSKASKGGASAGADTTTDAFVLPEFWWETPEQRLEWQASVEKCREESFPALLEKLWSSAKRESDFPSSCVHLQLDFFEERCVDSVGGDTLRHGVRASARFVKSLAPTEETGADQITSWERSTSFGGKEGLVPPLELVDQLFKDMCAARKGKIE